MIDRIMSGIRDRTRERAAAERAVSPQALEERASRERQHAAEGSVRLKRLDDAVAVTAEAIGERPPAPPTLRGRIGSVLVRPIVRVLRWQREQIRACLSAVVRRNRAQAEHSAEFERNVIDSLAAIRQALADLDRRTAKAEEAQVETEVRLQDLETAQLRLQSAQLEARESGPEQQPRDPTMPSPG
jgi:hypothetical protein